ncbi:transcription factor IIA, alpha/beta subunit-domain-containing protein [Dioszegia hungarica]|uniref:Transcription initiation factor IIA large subunit n=1 Tax=Dioszegia hungarica TaxID=4972 RepID=A0AA38H8E2_9TREE|nr:transcription factor IIA, alpha/beta subunit-domain-containing protein [Dioszegia hungarica]KAI9634774.1 transcription factor IIA, alpha/beta subunit-domain-containing protein [Dioszegia hungarica]
MLWVASKHYISNPPFSFIIHSQSLSSLFSDAQQLIRNAHAQRELPVKQRRITRETTRQGVSGKMSNKIVPQIYRQIIDDVMASIEADFEEYGMEEEVLQTLQAKWEAKLLETRVADFNRAPGAGPSGSAADIDDSPPADSRTSTASSPPKTAAAGPSSRAAQGYPPSGAGPSGGGLAIPGRPMAQPPIQGWSGQEIQIKQDPDDVLRMRGGAPSEELVDVKPEPNAAGLLPGDEIIDSDLDDSDDELKDADDEEGEGDTDIVFCTYDKVQRVKNKWKTTFKDGMVHINGRDYLFAKCTGEFEW